MKVGLLTSNYQRHTFFANHLARNLPVEVVVIEPKAASPREVGKNNRENFVLNQYFDQRDHAEKEILTGGERLNLPSHISLVETPASEISGINVVEQLVARGVDTLAVFGTSILKDPLLSAFQGRIVNIHLGVSPYYRGSGTNFWAMYNEDLHLVGSTIHYMDAGIDTGEIICHVQAQIVDGDTPHTIGNHVIKDSVYTMGKVLRLLADGPILSVPQWKTKDDHYCRRSDFTADALTDLLNRWEQGLIRRFLDKQADNQLKRVQLVPVPEMSDLMADFSEGAAS